jgi:hypothetical protein
MEIADEGHAPVTLSQETETYPLYGGLGDPLETLWKGVENMDPPRIDLQTVQPVSTLYNDYAIPAH